MKLKRVFEGLEGLRGLREVRVELPRNGSVRVAVGDIGRMLGE